MAQHFIADVLITCSGMPKIKVQVKYRQVCILTKLKKWCRASSYNQVELPDGDPSHDHRRGMNDATVTAKKARVFFGGPLDIESRVIQTFSSSNSMAEKYLSRQRMDWKTKPEGMQRSLNRQIVF